MELTTELKIGAENFNLSKDVILEQQEVTNPKNFLLSDAQFISNDLLVSMIYILNNIDFWRTAILCTYKAILRQIVDILNDKHIVCFQQWYLLSLDTIELTM